jgi:hypothetical protein
MRASGESAFHVFADGADIVIGEVHVTANSGKVGQ